MINSDRRQFLTRAGLFGTVVLALPGMSFARAGGGERRFVFVIQRGAADGLGTLAPVGDPAFTGLRGDLAHDFAGASPLDGMFALHPAMPGTRASFARGEALFVHAAASAYRDRSHFDGQNVLETGGTRPYERPDGWLNRLIGLLSANEARALAFAATVPPALRGGNPVSSYASSRLPDPSDDLLARVSALYQGDERLHLAWEESQHTQRLASAMASAAGNDPKAQGALAASFLAAPDGPRVAMIETSGWDTHSAQRARLSAGLRSLDELLGALGEGLGPLWAQTMVIVATEFGRTAAINGTAGTDHGTASLAMLTGGAVKGGRVLADWPGLAPAQLLEKRDLRPTTALEALFAGAAAEHFALDPALVGRTLFPGLKTKPIAGLIR
jgi:uncharacterized protein (DUF1501 family)